VSGFEGGGLMDHAVWVGHCAGGNGTELGARGRA
jgi:hypothetical protein